jgi:hypothetical protein
MAFSDPLIDLEHLIADAMGNALEGARRALTEQLRRRSESGLREARERGFRDLRQATVRLDGARTQAELLSALLEEGGRFASRTALLLTFADGARGWAAYGFADHAQGIDELRLSYAEAGLGRLAGGRGAVTLSADESAGLARRLGGEPGTAGVLVPLVLRDRIAAAFYADQLRPADPFVPAALQLLVFTAAQLLESQGMRDRDATPTLAGIDSDEAGHGLPLWDPAAVEAAAAAPAASAAPAAAPPAPARPAPPPPAPPSLTAAPDTTAWEPPRAPWEEAAEEAAEEPPAAAATASAWESSPAEHSAAEQPATPEPAWQPTWRMEEAAAPEVEAVEEPSTAVEGEAWVYTDQSYEGTAVEELPSAEAFEDTASMPVEEVAAEQVADDEPTAWERPEPARLEPPTDSSTWSPVYPSEATVRISRDALETAAAAAPAPPVIPDGSEDRTVRLQRAAPAPPPPPAELEETHTRPSPATPRPAPVFGGVGGSTEVQPPPDLEGPGWAFRAGEVPTANFRQQTEETSALHEEARRLARLLVSEIKLYNEEQVEEGRRQRDIYPRLQEDIDRSRQMYEERVDPRVRGEVDYFQQEMVSILAGGDAAALGI